MPNIILGLVGGSVTFDPSNSALIATTVQAAIDEIMNEHILYLAPANANSLEAGVMAESGTTLFAGKLSAGNTNYKAGDPAGSTVSYIATDGDFTLTSPSPSDTFADANQGILRLLINDVEVDNYDIGTAFNFSERAGAQSYPPVLGSNSKLRIDAVEWYNNYPSWQKGNFTVLVSVGDLRQGWNKIHVVHDLTVDRTTADFDIFLDNDAGADPSVTVPTVVENTPVFRWMSGVKHYSRASTFDLSCVASDCFDNVYHQTSPLTFDSSGGSMGSGNITEVDGSVSGLSTPPAIGEIMTVTNKLLTVPTSNVRSLNARATVTPRDPYGSYSAQQSASENRLIDGYVTTANALNEYFDDENRRLPAGAYDTVPSPITGQWSSGPVLTNGNAQIAGGQLIYPQTNYSTGYLPTQATNYSAFSGNQAYYRTFYQTTPHTNGTLEVLGSGFTDISPVGTGNLNVEIKLPTQTGWLDLGTNYSGGTFTGVDGDGCRTGKSGNQYSWTSGSFSTASSGDLIVVRVTLRNSGVVLTQLREIGW